MIFGPQLSIIVPVFNGEKTLVNCINSLIGQPYQNFELIIVNDGSTDNSAVLINNLLKQDARIKSISQKNQGLSSARNAGLKLAFGKYISFVDCDDVVDCEFYTSAFEKNIKSINFDLFVAGMERFSNEKILDEKHQALIGTKDLFKAVFCSNHIGLSVCNKIFSHRIILDHKLSFQPVHFAEDIVFLSDYLVFAQTIVYSPKSLYKYTVSAGSMTNSAKEQRQFKSRDYEILDSLDLASKSASFLNSKDFRHYFAIRAVRSSIRLILLMLWCHEYSPKNSQRAVAYVRFGIRAYFSCSHTSLMLKIVALFITITPLPLLNFAMYISRRQL